MVAGFLYLTFQYHRRKQNLHARQVLAQMEGMETERKRIAADLHDEIGSLLTYTKLKVASLHQSADLRKDQEDINGHLVQMHDALLHIINDLVPDTLQRNGLCHAIEEFVTEFQGQLPLRISFSADDFVDDRLPPFTRLHVYRITKELLQNTIKHSRASQVKLEMETRKHRLHIFYSDNGKGFDQRNQAKQVNGLGLRNIQSRIELLNGKVKTITAPGKGVTYHIQIPVKNGKQDQDHYSR